MGFISEADSFKSIGNDEYKPDSSSGFLVISADSRIEGSSVKFRDFQPINKWTPDFEGRIWVILDSDGRTVKDPMTIIDHSTQRRYLNEFPGTIRCKSFWLILGTPIAGLCGLVYRVVKLVTLAHFWLEKEEEKSYSLKGRLVDAGADFLKIITAPLVIIGLELAAIYGVFRPYDGRKLYATIERAAQVELLAPCFQPEPTYHIFGGDLNKPNAW